MLSVDFQKTFPGLSLDVAFKSSAGVTALFGPSGCGKTTTINAVAGLVTPDSGQIQLDGRTLFDHWSHTNLPPQQRNIGYVFQDARLFPHLTVEANLRYPARFKKGADRDFAHIVEMLALGPLLKRRPLTLSGGEKQRTAIGRALLSDPAILIMDEPLAALDEPRKAEIMPWLERLRDEVRLPILYVSHAPEEVLRLATTLVLMDRGRVTYAGPLDQALSDPEIGPRIGPRESGALIEGTVEGIEPDGLYRVQTPAGPLLLPGAGLAAGDQIRLRILGHEVILSREVPQAISALNVLPATVEQIMGGHVRLRIGATHLLAQVTQRSVTALQLQPGISCHAIIKSAAIIRS